MRSSTFFCQLFLLAMPSQAFEARFVAYLHVVSLSVSVGRMFHFQTLVKLITLRSR